MVEAAKISKMQTDQLVSPFFFCPALDGNSNFSLEFVALFMLATLYYIKRSCVNSLITVGPGQSLAVRRSCGMLLSENAGQT